MSSKIHVVCAVYGGKNRSFWRKFRRVADIFGSDPKWALGEVIACDTSGRQLAGELATVGARLIQADNRFNDWSAYAAGIGMLVADGSLEEGDAVVVLNQTLFEKYPWKWIVRRIHAYADFLRTARPSLCGFRDRYGFLMDFHPTGGNLGHVSCFCAAMNKTAAVLLLENHAKVEAATRGVGVQKLSEIYGAGFDPKAVEFVEMFIKSRATHFAWRRSIEAVRDDDAVHARKAASLLLELELSAAVSKHQGFLVDVGHQISAKAFFLVSRKLMAMAAGWFK